MVRFQIFFGDALKTHVKVCCSRPLCWHFCWYRGSERSLRISLFRTRELTRSLQNLGCLDQLGKVQTFRYCEAGFLSLPTPRDTGERNCSLRPRGGCADGDIPRAWSFPSASGSRSFSLPRQRSHVRIVSGAPVFLYFTARYARPD